MPPLRLNSPLGVPASHRPLRPSPGTTVATICAAIRMMMMMMGDHLQQLPLHFRLNFRWSRRCSDRGRLQRLPGKQERHLRYRTVKQLSRVEHVEVA